MKSELRNFSIAIHSEIMYSQKSVINYLWDELDKILKPEFGDDIHYWYDCKIIRDNKFSNPSQLGNVFEGTVQITPILELWEDLEKVTERLKIGI